MTVQKAIAQAERFFDRRKFSEALEKYLEAYKQDSANDGVIEKLIRCYVELGRQVEAADFIRKQADNAKKLGRSQKAAALYKQSYQLNPGNTEVLQLLAIESEQAGKNLEAVQFASELISRFVPRKFFAKASESLRQLVRLNQNQDDYKNAWIEIQLYSNTDQGINHLLVCMLGPPGLESTDFPVEGDAAKVNETQEILFYKLAKYLVQSPMASYGAAWLAYRMGKLQHSIYWIRQTLLREPNFSLAYILAARIFSDAKENKGAVYLIKQAKSKIAGDKSVPTKNLNRLIEELSNTSIDLKSEYDDEVNITDGNFLEAVEKIAKLFKPNESKTDKQAEKIATGIAPPIPPPLPKIEAIPKENEVKEEINEEVKEGVEEGVGAAESTEEKPSVEEKVAEGNEIFASDDATKVGTIKDVVGAIELGSGVAVATAEAAEAAGSNKAESIVSAVNATVEVSENKNVDQNAILENLFSKSITTNLEKEKPAEEQVLKKGQDGSQFDSIAQESELSTSERPKIVFQAIPNQATGDEIKIDLGDDLLDGKTQMISSIVSSQPTAIIDGNKTSETSRDAKNEKVLVEEKPALPPVNILEKIEEYFNLKIYRLARKLLLVAKEKGIDRQLISRKLKEIRNLEMFGGKKTESEKDQAKDYFTDLLEDKGKEASNIGADFQGHSASSILSSDASPDTRTNLDLGVAHLESELFGEAEKFFNAAVEKGEQEFYFDALYLLAMSQAKQRKFPEAIANLNKIIFSPDLSKEKKIASYYELAEIFQQTAQSQRAQEYFEIVAKIDPGYRMIKEKVIKK